MRVAVGGRKYLLLPTNVSHDDRFTEKMQRQFGRVAKSVGLHMHVGVHRVSLRDEKASRGAPPIIYTDSVSELAVTLLTEYRERGGRMA